MNEKNQLSEQAELLRLAYETGTLSGLDLREVKAPYMRFPNGLTIENAQVSHGTRFSYAILEAAVITGKLGMAHFDGATLTGATFRSVKAHATNFAEAIMPGTRFEGLEADLLADGASTYEAVSFNRANLSRSEFRNVRFLSCKFENADLSRTRFINCEMNGCRLAGANLTNADLTGLRLVRTSTGNATLTGARGNLMDPSEEAALKNTVEKTVRYHLNASLEAGDDNRKFFRLRDAMASFDQLRQAKRITHKQLAQGLGMAESTYFYKLREQTFKAHEIEAMLQLADSLTGNATKHISGPTEIDREIRRKWSR